MKTIFVLTVVAVFLASQNTEAKPLQLPSNLRFPPTVSLRRNSGSYLPAPNARFIDAIGLFARNGLSNRIDQNEDDIKILDRLVDLRVFELERELDNLEDQING